MSSKTNAMKKEVEPIVTDLNENLTSSNTILSRYLNWYNYEKDQSDAYQYLKDYVKIHRPNDVKMFSKVSEKNIKTTFGWTARLSNNGATLKESTHARINKHITDLLSIRVVDTPDTVVEVVARPTIQESLLKKQTEFLGELSAEFDNFVANNCKPTNFDLYKYMRGLNLPKQFGVAVGSLFESAIDEIDDIANNEQLQEAYSCYTDAQLRRTKEWLQKQIDDGHKYAEFKKANRKPKAKKEKSPLKQIEKLKYLKEYPELNIKSVGPTTIIGANQLWVYNVKYRRLGCYYASGASGFTVKGTTVQDYDPEVSVWKTLRKPNETIDAVLKGGKLQLQVLLKNLTTTASPLNGRINEEVILLRVL